MYEKEKNWKHEKKDKNTLTQFQICNRNNLILMNRIIKSLSSRENTFGGIRTSIKICLHSFKCGIRTIFCF